MCQVQSGGDTNHTAHYSWSLIETSCKSTIKQEVSTLPGTSINRSMTFQMRTWGCKLQRSNKLWDTPAHRSIWYVSTCLPMSQHVLTHEVLILNPSFEIDVICKYEKKYDAKFIVSDSFISQCDTLPPCKRLRLARGGRCRNPCATSLGPEKHLVARCTIAQRTQWTGTGTQQVDAIDINWHELAQHFRFLRPLLT